MFTLNGGTLVPTATGSISAAGSNQATATTLTAWINMVATVAAGQGVRLANVGLPMVQRINNMTTTDLVAYPASGGAIDALGANAGITIAPSGRVELSTVDGTLWATA